MSHKGVLQEWTVDKERGSASNTFVVRILRQKNCLKHVESYRTNLIQSALESYDPRATVAPTSKSHQVGPFEMVWMLIHKSL